MFLCSLQYCINSTFWVVFFVLQCYIVIYSGIISSNSCYVLFNVSVELKVFSIFVCNQTSTQLNNSKQWRKYLRVLLITKT